LYGGGVVAARSLLGFVLVMDTYMILHMVRRAAAKEAIVLVSTTGEALVTGDQLDGGSPRGRDGRPEVADVTADVITLTVLEKLKPEVFRCSGYVVNSLSMVECFAGEESAMAIVFANQNPECLVVVKPYVV
jgi:hypothetical protein